MCVLVLSTDAAACGWSHLHAASVDKNQNTHIPIPVVNDSSEHWYSVDVVRLRCVYVFETNSS